MLTVVNPTEKVVQFMDPLKRRFIISEWRAIVDNSIKIYNAQKHKKRQKISYVEQLCEQRGGKTCRLWIIHYMKDIVEDKNQEWSAKVIYVNSFKFFILVSIPENLRLNYNLTFTFFIVALGKKCRYTSTSMAHSLCHHA
ncbi:uncharacterized protein LOC121052631 [Rosa chinensis]|uniref:uncharacterized protein LOC121052629 n=1 Tax=Rosa chinensis TaxID=74649 RepID=UPI001AD8F3FD|nr:uncharacterized protein LOC121052629 [Rosa chinensis]XP_040373915.1 uncharacterized protein LOC121052631 [Rosa chinensis]